MELGDIRQCKLCGCEFGHFGPRPWWCRTCYNKKAKESRQSRSPEQAKRAKETKARGRARKTQHMVDYLKTHPCVDCGETRIPTLQFDHRDQSTKTMQVSVMPARGNSIAAIDAEIAKCDVRCASCHAVRTAKQCGWYNKQDLAWVYSDEV